MKKEIIEKMIKLFEEEKISLIIEFPNNDFGEHMTENVLSSLKKNGYIPVSNNIIEIVEEEYNFYNKIALLLPFNFSKGGKYISYSKEYFSEKEDIEDSVSAMNYNNRTLVFINFEDLSSKINTLYEYHFNEQKEIKKNKKRRLL